MSIIKLVRTAGGLQNEGIVEVDGVQRGTWLDGGDGVTVQLDDGQVIPRRTMEEARSEIAKRLQ